MILAIQRLDTAVLSPINLNTIVEKVKVILEAEINETDAVIHKTFDPDFMFLSLSPYVESIVLNLLSNAIKYRHPERAVQITIKATHEDAYVRIDVTDNGLGMDVTQHKENIFNLYKRFHFHVEGKGLGLYLVRTQVEALGGRIEVMENVTGGLTFTFWLKR